jgi:exodeoxyribonuclease V gamma subunit
LALAVTEASDSFSAHLVAKDGDRTLISPPADQALLILSDLVDLYRTGLHSPLPLMPATSQLYAKRRASGASISAAVRAADFGCWRSRYAADREAVEVVRLWGRDPDLSQLLAQKPADNENWFDEVTRFGMLARRLWQPVLDAGGGR